MLLDRPLFLNKKTVWGTNFGGETFLRQVNYILVYEARCLVSLSSIPKRLYAPSIELKKENV